MVAKRKIVKKGEKIFENNVDCTSGKQDNNYIIIRDLKENNNN